jgi:hypothetical protein
MVTLGRDLDAQLDAARRARAVGGELPPAAALIRAAVAAGLPSIETPSLSGVGDGLVAR